VEWGLAPRRLCFARAVISSARTPPLACGLTRSRIFSPPPFCVFFAQFHPSSIFSSFILERCPPLWVVKDCRLGGRGIVSPFLFLLVPTGKQLNLFVFSFFGGSFPSSSSLLRAGHASDFWSRPPSFRSTSVRPRTKIEFNLGFPKQLFVAGKSP